MASKSKTQIWIEYAFARGIFGLLEVLPRRLAVYLGLSVARLGFYVLPHLRRVAQRNLEIVFPEMDAAEKTKLIKRSFESLGRMLGEASQFGKISRDRIAEIIEFRFDPEEEARYKAIRSQGRGAIILSPHMGNWELLVFAYSALREPVSYLARPIDNPMVEDLTVRVRTRFGNRPINKTNSVSEALGILRSGGTLGILADVNAHPREGVFVPFFGIPACTSTGVAMLAKRANAIIVPLCCVWDSAKKQYRVLNGRIIEPGETGDRQRDILETTAAFTAEIEQFVRAYPDQWLWIHKRWKTRPPGEKGLY